MSELRTIDIFDDVGRRVSAGEYLEKDIIRSRITVNMGAFMIAKPGYDIGYGNRDNPLAEWPCTLCGREWVELWFAGPMTVKMTVSDFENQISTPAPCRLEEEESQ